MMNNIFGMFDPQMQSNFQNLQQEAMRSGNPQQFLVQRYGNDPLFMQGIKIFNEQGIQGLQNYIASKMNR